MVNPLRSQFKFTPGVLFTYVIVFIIIVQLISLAISSVFTDVPMFKSGPLLIIISIGLAAVFLAKVVFKGTFEKTDFIGFLLIVGVALLLHYFGAQFLPQIFSFIDTSALESTQSLASTIGLPIN